MKIPVINKSQNPLPKYAHLFGDSGVDLMAEISKVDKKFLFNSELKYDQQGNIDSVVINPLGRALIPTEIYTAIPNGYEIQIRSRSGLALKNAVIVLNEPGTVDAIYRNSHGVILMNLGSEPFIIHQGDRIAQGVLCKVEQIEWEEVTTLDETERNLDGFGSTGIN